jgi:hypothetical protein
MRKLPELLKPCGSIISTRGKDGKFKNVNFKLSVRIRRTQKSDRIPSSRDALRKFKRDIATAHRFHRIPFPYTRDVSTGCKAISGGNLPMANRIFATIMSLHLATPTTTHWCMSHLLFNREEQSWSSYNARLLGGIYVSKTETTTPILH